MEKLEKFLEDVGSIANSLKILVGRTKPVELKFSGETKEGVVQEALNQLATAPTVPVQNVQPQIQVAPVQNAQIQPQAPVAQMPQAPVQQQAPIEIPVSQSVENFTQEQIARALANASSIGRADIVKNIFNTFKVQTLMEINPANYNQIATMLREAGIQI